LVDGWRKYFGHENYTVENVQCDGCLSDGRIADKMCKARSCAKKKAVENCALCDEFPCDKVKSLMAHRIGMLMYCSPKTFSMTEEEYSLCTRQFESMSNLIKALKKNGKAPAWW